MASIRQRGGAWVAEVCVDRARRSKSFALKRDAIRWARDQEEMSLPGRKTLLDALALWEPTLQPDQSRKRYLEAHSIAQIPLEQYTTKTLADFRDARAKEVSSATVRRDMGTLAVLLKKCIEMGWLKSIPEVKKPPVPPARRRGIPAQSIDPILNALKRRWAGEQIGQMFLFALETAMRQGEICGLTWDHVRAKAVTLPKTKNGDAREVALSPKAREIIESRRGKHPTRVFTVDERQVSRAFGHAKQDAGYPDVRFHDARSEAITRLSKKLDILQLAKMVGHRDLKSLMHYYAEKADDIADRL